MPGPSPKPASLRQRRNRTATAATLDAPPATRVALPSDGWHVRTVAWWATIWDSPMADEWVDADVPGLLVLAALVDEFWRTGAATVAAEIRLQQREYGLSPLSRRQLQWEIKRVSAPKPAVVSRMRSRRSVLSALRSVS